MLRCLGVVSFVFLGWYVPVSLKLAPDPPVTPAGGPATDVLAIMDWERRLVYEVRFKPSLRTGPLPATPLRRDDLADMPIRHERPMSVKEQACLLRDVATGEIHPAGGIWCWSLRDGVENDPGDGQAVINAHFAHSEGQPSRTDRKHRRVTTKPAPAISSRSSRDRFSRPSQ